MSLHTMMTIIGQQLTRDLAVLNGLRSGPQGRPPARSDAPAGRVSEDVARPEGRAERQAP
jgi:hypothetical protein